MQSNLGYLCVPTQSYLKVKEICTSGRVKNGVPIYFLFFIYYLLSASPKGSAKKLAWQKENDCALFLAKCGNCETFLRDTLFHDILVHLHTHYWFKASHFYSRQETHDRDMLKFISCICERFWVWTQAPILFGYCPQHKTLSPKGSLTLAYLMRQINIKH